MQKRNNELKTVLETFSIKFTIKKYKMCNLENLIVLITNLKAFVYNK